MTENKKSVSGKKQEWPFFFSHGKWFFSPFPLSNFALVGILFLFHTLYRYSVLSQSVKADSHYFSEAEGKKEEGIAQTPQCGRHSVSHHIMTISALLILAALVGSCAQFTGKVHDTVIFTVRLTYLVHWIICHGSLSSRWRSHVMRSERIGNWIVSLL